MGYARGILLKDENALRGEVYHAILKAAQTGRISEERLEDAVTHVLTAKERCGLLDGSGGIVSAEETRGILTNPELSATAKEAAELAAKAKEVILAADMKHSQALAANIKKFVWDLDNFVSGQNKSGQVQWS